MGRAGQTRDRFRGRPGGAGKGPDPLTHQCQQQTPAGRRTARRRSSFAAFAGVLAACLLTGVSGLALSGCGSGDDERVSSADRRFELSDLRRATITAEGRQYVTWIADQPAVRGEGMQLVYDFEVRADQGMLFVYPSEAPRSFFGREVRIPLDLAFLDASGRVVTVHRINPFDETPRDSTAPAKYAVELKAGEFQAANIRVGTVFQIPAFADDQATD